MVLPDGTLLGCSCVAAMDGSKDLGIGNILERTLGEIWTGREITEMRAGFTNGKLNATCSGCDMYRDLELYRTSEGRRRAEVNRARAAGEIVKAGSAPEGPFSGG